MNELNYNIFGKKKPPIYRQAEASDCGLTCLAMIASYHGAPRSINDLRKLFGLSSKGVRLNDLIGVAHEIGFSTRALKCEINDLRQLNLPAILHWDLNHFVVIYKISTNGKKVYIIDPALGELCLSREEVGKRFTGIVLELFPGEQFEEITKKRKVRILDLLNINFWHASAFVKLVILSLFVQMFLLISPLFVQFVVDQTIVGSDRELLLIFSAGFVVVKIFETLTNFLRSLVLNYLTSAISIEMESNIFEHLLRLPMAYFQKRRVGDVQQRFSSIKGIQNFLVGQAPGVVIDGFFSISIAIALAAYDIQLSVLIFAFLFIYSTIRLFGLRSLKNISMQSMVCEADEQTSFLDTLRAIQTIKILNIESSRSSAWKNLSITAENKRIKYNHLDVMIKSINNLLLGVGSVFVICLLAIKVIENQMTIGMMMGFIAYKTILEGKVVSLIEYIFNFGLLQVNIERLEDIIEAEPEPTSATSVPLEVGSGFKIELNKVGFRYFRNEPYIFENIDLEIKSGEFVALIGPSGIGKSTMLKILMGALIPTEGEILYNGIRSEFVNLREFRRNIGVVLQDDKLLSGTIEQNITLFSDAIDNDRLDEACRAAAIYNDILRMPMGYRSFVGDMGAGLSGGQVQRLLLARALYRQPRLLIMDEGTSNLDVETEKKVNDALMKMDITRIIAAHRPDTILKADRVLQVSKNIIREVDYKYRGVGR